MKRSVAERFAARLVAMPNGCLEWTGQTVRGYGKIKINGSPKFAHRVAWESANGPIPEGLCVCHACDNRPCCQTEPTPGFPNGHLFLGTIADNNADMDAKGRRRGGGKELRTHCKRGHPYDEANTYVNPKGARECRACIRGLSPERAVANRAKTHCPQGHEYAGANLILAQNGDRTCRICKRASDARRQASQPKKGNARSAKTHCPQGHEYAGENLGITKNGARFCRTCRREWKKKAALKMKAAQTVSTT